MEIEIREARAEDAARLVDIYRPYVLDTAITYEYEVPTTAEFQMRIAETKKKYPYLVLLCDGIIRGYTYAGVFKNRAAYDRSCEMSVYVEEGYTKLGLGKKLYNEMEKRLKEQGVLNLYACIAYPEKEDEYLNKNSASFHEHMGYTLVGEFHKCAYKFGRWYNMIWMEKFIGEHK